MLDVFKNKAYSSMVARYIYSHRFIKKSGVRFLEGLTLCEDFDFQMKCFVAANSLYSTGLCFYRYRNGRAGSVTDSHDMRQYHAKILYNKAKCSYVWLSRMIDMRATVNDECRFKQELQSTYLSVVKNEADNYCDYISLAGVLTASERKEFYSMQPRMAEFVRCASGSHRFAYMVRRLSGDRLFYLGSEWLRKLYRKLKSGGVFA
jgi:hypothetical protein